MTATARQTRDCRENQRFSRNDVVASERANSRSEIPVGRSPVSENISEHKAKPGERVV